MARTSRAHVSLTWVYGERRRTTGEVTRIMVLVNEAAGYRVCLECHDVLEHGADEEAWLAVHLGEHGCANDRESWWHRILPSRRRGED